MCLLNHQNILPENGVFRDPTNSALATVVIFSRSFPQVPPQGSRTFGARGPPLASVITLAMPLVTT